MNAESNAPSPSPESSPAQRFPAPADYVPLTLMALSVAAMIGGMDAAVWLRYDRALVLDGQVWRLFTGHLIHLGWTHLALNLAGLALIWLLFGRAYSVLQWTAILLVCALGIGLGFVLFRPELIWYVGLSGVLHGLFVAGAVAGIFAGYKAEWLLLGLLALKLFREQFFGPLEDTARMIGGLVVVDAHLYGALVGLCAALIIRFANRP